MKIPLSSSHPRFSEPSLYRYPRLAILVSFWKWLMQMCVCLRLLDENRTLSDLLFWVLPLSLAVISRRSFHVSRGGPCHSSTCAAGSAGTILWSRSTACPLALTAVRGAAMSSRQSWAASVIHASPLLAEKLDVHS